MEMKYDLVAVGNAIVDVMADATDEQLTALGLPKGSMEIVDAEMAEDLYRRIGPAREMSGGSAANTTAGMAAHGSRVAFIGMTGADQLGDAFRHDIRAAGVDFDTNPIDEATGRCLVLVTPCGQRTMRTYIGAAGRLPMESLNEDRIRKAGMLLVEGYLWSDPETRRAVIRAMEIANEEGRPIAFGASSVSCIEANMDDFQKLMLEGWIDLLFANEEEVEALTHAGDFKSGAHQLAEQVGLVVATRGRNGASAITRLETFHVPAKSVERVVDTTGAGDSFCAGFLHAFVNEEGMLACLESGAVAAARTITHHGARPFSGDLRS